MRSIRRTVLLFATVGLVAGLFACSGDTVTTTVDDLATPDGTILTATDLGVDEVINPDGETNPQAEWCNADFFRNEAPGGDTGEEWIGIKQEDESETGSFYQIAGFDITISDDDRFLDWDGTGTSNVMQAVITKPGSDAYAYFYNPYFLDDGDLVLSGGEIIRADEGLSGKQQGGGISHFVLCYTEGQTVQSEGLIVSKTAEGTYDVGTSWTLEKHVTETGNELTEYTGEPGDEFPTDWLVSVTKTEGESNWQVSGTITIQNPNDFDVDFSIVDVLNDAEETAATVACPVTDDHTGTVPAAVDGENGVITCDYTASPDDTDADVNTAVVTPDHAELGPTEATADITWTANEVGFVDEGTLTDDRFPDFSETVTDDASFTLSETFICSSDASDYTDGEYSMEVVNTAYLNGDLNLEDAASVTLTCELDPLVPSKDATGAHDRTVTWSLDKYVNAVDTKLAEYAGGPGATFPTDWLLHVDKTVVESYTVTGTITIENPAPIAQDFTVSDELDDGTVAAVDCDPETEGDQASGTVPAGESVECSYAADATADASVNTATVSAAGNPDQTATAEFTYTENLIGSEEGTLTDDRFPAFEETVSGDASFTLSETFTCPTDVSLYVDGHYYEEIPNEADLNGNIDLQSSATATLMCSLVKETAYAFGGEGDPLADPSLCFIDEGFGNWGWTNQIEPGIYTWSVYAAAGRCDTSKGMLAGTVTVDYDPDAVVDEDKLTVTWDWNSGFALADGEYHVYAGAGKFPTVGKGRATVAPGQYEIDHDALNGDAIWVILHAVVYVPPEM